MKWALVVLGVLLVLASLIWWGSLATIWAWLMLIVGVVLLVVGLMQKGGKSA